MLECVTANTAKLITENISIPTIGIGASRYCDGQVLVFDDLINLSTNDKKPKFVKNYLNFNKIASNVVKKYKWFWIHKSMDKLFTKILQQHP